MVRIKQLPLIMYKIKDYLKTQMFKCSNKNEDGRINSSIDENIITFVLL